MREIISKYFEGRATGKELQQLLEWLRQKENHLEFNRLKLDWKNRLGHDQFPDGGERSWDRLQSQLWQKSYDQWQKTRKIHRFLRAAAIFFFLVSIGSLAWFFTNDPQVEGVPETYTGVITENGQISKVELPDGSVVWLNSGSKITYNNFFAANNRKVNLKGEAYFDVVKNKAIPLIVDCGELKVKVLGTRFNVNSYSPESSVEVVLEEGSVELFHPKSDNAFCNVKPGERVRVNTLYNQYTAGMVNTSRYTSWKEGIINIYDLPIKEVVERLEKRYNQPFELTPGVKDLRYTFTIQNEGLEDILHLMERITPVKIEQVGHIITIKEDKQKMREVRR